MVSGTPEGYRVYDTLRGLSVSGASAVFSCSGLRIHKTRFRLHTARVSSRQHGGRACLCPERGHTGRHKAKGGAAEFARFGNAVASLNVAGRGAIPAMPTMEAVRTRLAGEA